MKKQDKKTEEKIIDAEGKILGRVASEIAISLMGKNSSSYERHVYSGFPVKVINASKLKITIKKLEEIYHTRYSGYRGGLRVIKGTETKEKKGLKELIKLSVYHMLPGNKLRREMMKNLVVED
ncbi:50S ribosomal protein L13 [Candidatus Nomurabacteria bacterium CG22_combo_CG10-13_8_21_14_all_32_8]|uniref:50S ribosomal protein L13 n=2 Tax=Candidatus Nomuraibacteriota TaxID=1752729 RepID=A0A2H0CFY6_9BACT|nr:MAG: 50S ribosomal protein L13 [Candidatus Nomurabacteria bacterium CG22_combo_CG10-13_8_21_14_all_32_8]PIZ85700.1 MAG: 50S ribosomal protein L13 [Candidatus Nomurabacteria bacterium CG_4_10_14_0_2_um_filter_33_9]